eukprot:GHVP01028724.1.p1 GENE.GHVP01028724.1~~GHVP01028724.1.p1  ORF type:complete len:216 (-),score=29.15 GHVP01028724.1:12-659(-)
MLLSGDSIMEPISKALNTDKPQNIVIGTGILRIKRSNDFGNVPSVDLVSTIRGELSFQKPNRFHIRPERIYIPRVGDCVIGLIIGSYSDNYKVDIGSPKVATLSYFSFEDASKRKKPKIKIGALVYVNIIESDRDLEVEVSCVDENGKTGEYGELVDGMLIRLYPGKVRRIIENNKLEEVGEKCSFEVAIGLNGRIWIKAKDFSVFKTVRDSLLK